jgi:hypothetical protein
MLEKLDGQSILSVSTTGNFSFADKIDGNSWLLVDKVAPAVAGGLGAFRGKIDGKSRVDITVDNPNANYHVEFFDKIDGASTVELWNTWFTTTGRELSGSSTVSYTEASLPPHFSPVHFGAQVLYVPNLLHVRPQAVGPDLRRMKLL